MDRNSTGDTPSVLCPRQAAGLPNNQASGPDRGASDLLSRELLTEREVDGLPEHRDVAPLMLRLFGAPKG